MICPGCGSYQSGDRCKLCPNVFKAKKEKTEIPKESKRRKGQNAEYKKLRIQFLKDNPRCAVYPRLAATTVHHGKGRIEDLLCDVSTWIAVSMKGHDFIERHPDWAKENGYSVPRYN